MRAKPHGNDTLQLSKEETWWICRELVELFMKPSKRSYKQ